MRQLSFDPQALRKYLLRHTIATLPELKAALGTSADLTVFRKLKLLDYLSSYTHRGRYYALREAARFDEVGLWSHDAVWFLVTAPLSPPSSPSSNSPPPAGSLMNWPTFSMLKSKILSTILCVPSACAAPRWPDDSFTLPPITGNLAINSAPGRPPSRFLC